MSRQMPPMPPSGQMMDHSQHYGSSADPYNEPSYDHPPSYRYNKTSPPSSMPPITGNPRATSSRGGHYRESKSHHHHPGQYNYHPYARPGEHYGGAGSAAADHAPYGGGAYDYYGEGKPYMPHSMTPHHQHHHQQQQQHGGPHHIDMSPQQEDEARQPPNQGYQHQQSPPQSRAMVQPHQHNMHPQQRMQQQPEQSSQKATKPPEVKKPPRSYTEYNIFFQLERERILGELEKEQRLKQEAENNGEEGVVKAEEEEGGVTTPKEEDKEASNTNALATTSPVTPKQGVILNRPSDSNDVLPRPTRFAHLKLAPLWYDSTHRLAQSKLNKARRKHRKTHGLVGFLDLTRRIAKAWSEVDKETKGYCKRVADRQLKIYKEELKMLKNKSSLLDNKNGGGGIMGQQDADGTSAAAMQLQLMRMRESAATSAAAGKGTVTAPPSQGYGAPQDNMQTHPHPPPPSSYPSSHQASHPDYSKYYQQYHQQQQQSHHPYPPTHQGYNSQGYHSSAHPHSSHHRGGPHSRPYYPPTIPPLTPTSEYPEDRYSGYYGGGPPGQQQPAHMHTPLDELMHRRKLYGARGDALQAAAGGRRRSPGTSRQERAEIAAANKLKQQQQQQRPLLAAKLAAETVDKLSSTANVADVASNADVGKKPAAASYLSPSDSPTDGGAAFAKTSATAAITPSPSRRHVAMSGTASAPSSAGSSNESNVTPGAAAGAPAMEPLTPSQLPMKKRRKMMLEREATGGSVASTAVVKKMELARGNSTGSSLATPGNNNKMARSSSINDDSSPNSTGMFSISPSGMLTPGGGGPGQFMGSPSFGASPMSTKKTAEASPFPYIDWGSPHDNSPQETGGSSGLSHRSAMPPHLAVPGSGYPHYPPPPPRHLPGYPSMPPSAPYGPGNPNAPPPIMDDFTDQDVLDLDEEEMQLLWRKLAYNAKRKRMRERDAAAAWMNYYGGNPSGSFAASPGGHQVFAAPPPPPMMMPGGTQSLLTLAHSFSSPVEKPEIVARGASVASGPPPLPPPDVDTPEAATTEKKKEPTENSIEEGKETAV